MIRYFFNHAHPDDGGHVFPYYLTTAPNHGTLRLPAEYSVIVQSCSTLQMLGEHDDFFTLNTRFAISSSFY
jgi:hypothetical protein